MELYNSVGALVDWTDMTVVFQHIAQAKIVIVLSICLGVYVLFLPLIKSDGYIPSDMINIL